jgi:hypothetical protein
MPSAIPGIGRLKGGWGRSDARSVPAEHPQATLGEDGFVLIEILVSAIVVMIVAGAVFTLLNATARSAGEERHRSEAYAVAQEDQARLRSLRFAVDVRVVARVPPRQRARAARKPTCAATCRS